MLNRLQKEIISFAMEQDISGLKTYKGYKGDNIIKIMTLDKATVTAIRAYVLSLDIEDVVVKYEQSHLEYEIYCVVENEGVYHLKADHEDWQS